MDQPHRFSGMFGFTVVWLGQIVSVLATAMSAFALTIWVFQKTGSATALGLVQVFFLAPLLLMTPFAGVMVDRHNRKAMMMISDLAAGVGTMAVLVLSYFGLLEVWHLYVAAVFQGVGTAFQWPAYSAAISTMIPKEQYGRANGMMSLVQNGPGIIAPMLAGALLPVIGLTGILSFDVITFVFAVLALLVVHIPQPARSKDGEAAAGHVIAEAVFGFKYIFARPSLLGLQLVFFFGNLSANIAFNVLAPMILLRTDNNSVIYGSVQAAGAVGGVLGSVILSLWGGFRKKVHGVLIGWIMCSFFFTWLGIGTWIPLWVAGSALAMLFSPMVDGSNQAIWQAKVPHDLQGRVFSARMIIAWIANPIAPLIGGLLGDYVFEPAMREPGAFANTFSRLVPPGPGAGMALLIIFSSLIGILAGAGGYLIPAIRNAESILPDHDEVTKTSLA